MVQPQLTPNAIERLYHQGAECFDTNDKPVVQVLSVKRLQSNPGAATPDRYRYASHSPSLFHLWAQFGLVRWQLLYARWI